MYCTFWSSSYECFKLRIYHSYFVINIISIIFIILIIAMSSCLQPLVLELVIVTYEEYAGVFLYKFYCFKEHYNIWK